MTGDPKGTDDTTQSMPVVPDMSAGALHRRRNAHIDEPGIPKSVERRRKSARIGAEYLADAARRTWALDLLAWARYGQIAPRIDSRGAGASLPPVILPDAPDGELVCLDLAVSVDRLRSRHRAFSQVAGRYSPLVLGARESGRRLRIEVWDLEGMFSGLDAFSEEATLPEISIADAVADGGSQRDKGDGLEAMLAKVATYIDADISLESLTEARALLAGLAHAPFPDELVARNPLAWVLRLMGDSGPGR